MRARGLQPSDVDDVLQDVAVRALRRGERFESEDHLVRWCCRVAINLHLDAVRRARRLGSALAPDVPDVQDTARTAERRMELEAVAAGIAELSPADQRLLLDPDPTSSRQETVRLAVRRHRIRARLTTLLEGVVVGVPVLRKVMQRLSTPAKAGVTAMPVVVVTAALFVLPSVWGPTGGGSSPAQAPRAAASERLENPVELIGRAPQTPSQAPAAHASRRVTPPPQATSGPRVRTVLQVDSPGPEVHVRRYERPVEKPSVCVYGHVNACVEQPGPRLPLPSVPPLP